MSINDDILYKIDSEIGKDKKVVELQREIKRLNRTNNEIFKANETLVEEIKKLQNQLQQKENIIKEVREYIIKQVHRNQQFYEMDIDNILEILNKESDTNGIKK